MTLEFLPGINPSFQVPTEHDWPVSSFTPEKPYEQIIPLGIRPVREVQVTYLGVTADQRDYFLSFFHSIQGQAGIFIWRSTDPVWCPLHAGPTLDQEIKAGAPGGARTYYVRHTWYDSVTGQETKPSPASVQTVVGGSVLDVEVPYLPAGVTAWRVYAHETAGEECLQDTISGTRQWVEPITGMVTLTPQAPAVNTLRPALKWRLVGKLRETKYRSSRWQIAMTWMEVWV
jgi:hypothetical protein